MTGAASRLCALAGRAWRVYVNVVMKHPQAWRIFAIVVGLFGMIAGFIGMLHNREAVAFETEMIEDVYTGETDVVEALAEPNVGTDTPVDSFQDCAECPAMVTVPAGTFTMGAPESEPWGNDDERPQRTISISAFAASAHEVTFAEWDACVAAGGCGDYSPDDGGWGRGNRPVVNVSWGDAQWYVDWLSRTTGQHYRLLTESEWEYAARAGTTTPFHTGGTITPQQANFDGRYDYPAGNYDDGGLYRRQTAPVGSFAPNGFGLYDMHGNVWEWVQDCHGSYGRTPSDGSAVEGDSCVRVSRGGSWNNYPWILRSAFRGWNVTGLRAAGDGGFRVARTL